MLIFLANAIKIHTYVVFLDKICDENTFVPVGRIALWQCYLVGQVLWLVTWPCKEDGFSTSLRR